MAKSIVWVIRSRPPAGSDDKIDLQALTAAVKRELATPKKRSHVSRKYRVAKHIFCEQEVVAII